MPKDTSVEALLNAARKELQSLGESVERLAQGYPEVFEASDLALRLDGFRAAHQEATERLKTPRLSIATIGTTSSGKSTIVNALIGRKLAPIDASEMSGGVLTFLHAGESRVVVEQTEGSVWETGAWTAQTDEEIYNRIRNAVMHPYHEERKKRSLAAPIVTVSSSLLPANDAQLIGIPSGVEIEIIDLPGLKSVQDKTNLTVIQDRVKKSFSLVALDYMQVDDEHRGALLIELSKVVDAMGGRAENAMLFILNRVDQRGADDNEISHRIQQLKKEIKDKLKLSEVPEVIAFSARPLYYAQCAWGSYPLNEESITLPQNRNQFINSLFNDCFNFIWQKTADDTELMQWFLSLAAQLKSGTDISEHDLRRVLKYMYEWSGAKELYQALNARIAKSWPEIILAPILLQSIQRCSLLTDSIETFCQARKIQSKAEVKAACGEIENTRKSLKKIIKQTEQEFQKELKDILDRLKEGTRTGSIDAEIQIEKQAKTNKWSGLKDLERAVKEVEIDLVDNLIIPVRDALKSKSSAFELEDRLQSYVGSVYANDIARAYDLVREN
ncbi:dynamin family protein [Nodosilinea sp. LEGE 07298]|uniref:dynamin family protein n=1 Tax=Nodosilinea sp. LEGE 07298 TaxID=2777970 RepID=UPI00187F90AD|nr:dynamin family protein [Nodosilinea sp. LEGE 07298]MBE9112453.1 dynamin family protein [Nodosilinea sp. LEGE 07298]